MTVHDLTPEYLAEKPFESLRLITYENPKALAYELTKLGFTAVPELPEPLFQYIYDYLYKKNGNRATIVGAFSRVPMLTALPATRASQQSSKQF